ncbi:hypothetical protein H6G97_03055 [Nostoc flagelliforme FACHB-838]|uniref:Transposase n=1 Tax=Nostoc flagelliforme FACHB-838 TaxID=2692904 RepID=A0ABR8DGS8_9NOSO|nr:hypothetical protein [Nostoc flagelliforme]MBD2528591.1 hypothetical protein [Nostoc flagelliforme FACHB-838]
MPQFKLISRLKYEGFHFFDRNTKKLLQIVEEALYTRSICHYHVRHCQLLTLLSQPKNIESAFLQSKMAVSKPPSVLRDLESWQRTGFF